MIRSILVLVLLTTATIRTNATIFTVHASPASTIQQPYLNFILDEAAQVWGVPFNEMEEAYNDGLVMVEETTVHAHYRVTLGGNSAIVSIEDRL